MLVKDVITAWNTYMSWLYFLGGIRCPTKVYFTMSTLAGDSRYHFKHSVMAKQVVGFCMNIVVIFSSNQLKRKYNARDFDKSKSANLLKILKGEHPTKKWQNCGTEMLLFICFVYFSMFCWKCLLIISSNIMSHIT